MPSSRGPHNRGPRCSAATAARAGRSSKIVIRAYRKPPALPDNYYEETSTAVLDRTLSVLPPPEGGGGTASPSTMSLQSAYQAVTDLVRHQLGARLYGDVVRSMERAAERVLPAAASADGGGGGAAGHDLLHAACRRYQRYTEYLLLCRHVLLPLDRAWQWHGASRRAVQVKNAGGSSAGQTAAVAAATPGQLQTLWQVGLTVFCRRLKELQLDESLYQQWFQALLADWNGDSSNKQAAVPVQYEDMKHTWYLWQDLGLLGQLPLEPDLQRYWSRVSDDYKAVVPYPLTKYLQFCFNKHHHFAITTGATVHAWWRPWLPVPWLWNILDVTLLEPHLNEEYLLNESYLHPVLTEHVAHASSTVQQQQQQHNTAPNTVQQLWMLAGRLPSGQQAVATALQQFARKQGLQRVRASSGGGSGNSSSNRSPPTAVQDLLQLQEKLSALIRSLPKSGQDPVSTISLKNVWEEVVNVDTYPQFAELLAKFLDQILKSNKKMDQYQSESTTDGSDGWLQRIVTGLFIPLQAKDVFEAFYRKDLAKRLLWNRVVSMDVEKQVCSLLKAECGAGYTSKMEGMFQDIDWSRETMMVYKQSQQASQPTSGAIEMEVQVLTTGYWPVYPQYPNLQLPEQLKTPQEQFGEHYKTKYQGRRITWQYALGHCVVQANGFNKPYSLIVNLVQALVLTQFKTDDSKWTLPQLMQAVGLEDRDEMERILQSLSLGKEGTRILRKIDHDAQPGKKMRGNVDDRDEFVIQTSFESNQRRIRITNIMMKETREEREKTVEGVSRDRLYLIDAVLVRILKARKTILHQALIPQVLEQVKVPAQSSDVKKRIESLIEREYMERDAKDRNRYNYLA